MNTAYLNLADSLHLAGRLREARAIADEGAEREQRANEAWLTILRAELAIEAGDWEEAERLLDEVRRRQVGTIRLNLDLRRAELALGRGEHAEARALLAEAAELAADVREPQFSHVLGALVAELERREGNLDAARRALQGALDHTGSRTDDLTRLARLTATGASVEADAAQRARDLGDDADERAALHAADAHVAQTEEAAHRDGPLEGAWLLVARAERTRAGGAADPAAFAAAAEAWEALERPCPAATLRLREAEAHLQAGDREAAATAARHARQTAGSMGARWLLGEVEGLAARARLDLGDDVPAAQQEPDAADDPFGLTRRERQVLELVARGATNREIGSELFMAEKTASVHVSRILAKLDVRTRTEAAGVAHRLRLTS
jgi:ATP/maltotriose-dependent transcriptional regulator MalT